jgi:hypothetical protein
MKKFPKFPRTRFCQYSFFFLVAWTAFAIIALAAPVPTSLEGKVETGGHGLAGYQVSLYGSFVDHGPRWMLLGSGISDQLGNFQITYSIPKGLANDQQPVLFVEAQDGPVVLASAIGIGTKIPVQVVVNERTTVATANAFAQFVDGKTITGNTYGMINAVSMAANFAAPDTGGVGLVLASTPNGTDTSTLPTFNSLTNVVASCVAAASSCAKLFAAATPPGQAAPTNLLQAMANIVKNPSYPGFPVDADDPVFMLSQVSPNNQPALIRRPTSWLLLLKITGGFYSAQDATNLMSGPGNFAIDKKGFVWVNTNYVPEPPHTFACAGLRLIEFSPSGEPVPGTPFTGGGLSGAGYGITLDPNGNVWIGDFGFQDPPCAFLPQAAPNNAVSEFLPDGSPISPSQGYTQGGISWPQGTVSDRKGNIWIGNCGNDTVTEFPAGDPSRAISVPLGPTPPAGAPQIKPFGLSVDLKGNIWTTNPGNSTVSVISPEGTLLQALPSTFKGKAVLTHPMGNAADVQGNIWVANSDFAEPPCPSIKGQGTGSNPSITMYQMSNREPFPGSPFSGGGLTLPWGIAIDAYDTVWVFNFSNFVPLSTPSGIPTGISRFCGFDTRSCPPGMRTGDPISPSTGYRSDAFERITGGQIDPSGNIWMTSNWKIHVNPFLNPGGNSIVIAIGAAGPINTPLIGPPVPFQ